MTYARYLALAGFKAFRDWSLLDLSPKVSVLVGRNGSGKSTLVEALLWVLGEQDLSLLRAGGPGDLLFRPAAGGLPERTEDEQHLLFIYPPKEQPEPGLADPRRGDGAAGESMLSGGDAAVDPGESEHTVAEEEAVAYLVLGDESDVETGEGDECGCCCKAVSEQRREVPEGLIAVKRTLGLSGDENWEIDNLPVSRSQVETALARHGLDRGAVSVIRQGELERILLADPQMRAGILADAAGVALRTVADEELLVLRLERDRLAERLAELRTETESFPLAGGLSPCGGFEEVIDGDGRDVFQLRSELVRSLLGEWGTEVRLTGGRERLLRLLGLAGGEIVGSESNPVEVLEELEREPAAAKPAQRNGPLDLRQSLLEERDLIAEALRAVELDLQRASSQTAAEEFGRRRLLQQAHSRVGGRFRRFFDMLVPGAQAELPLDLSGGLTCASLEIKVAFPGCCFERLEALSGGQRALVAFALGVAMFIEIPSRLMVLDEVEPALDESNLRRFNDLLHEIAETRQVVVVSHQRRTKDVGDVVFGVDVTGNGASMLHYRFEPASKRLIVFGRARGNWLERTAALEGEATKWSGPKSASLPASAAGMGAAGAAER
jgi:energy-coupling factor transporter ATP-binding protein EcfA2